MADAPTYASLTEEINSLKRLQKVHKARFDVAQKARRTKLDGPGEAVRQAQASRNSSRQGAKPARPPRPIRTHDARALSGEFPAKLLRMAYVPDENPTLHLHATHVIGALVSEVNLEDWRQTDDTVHRIVELNGVFSKWRANARTPFTSELTDGGLKHLGRRGPGLLDVNLAGVHLVSAAGVSALVTACPTLRSLNLAGCSQLFDAAVLAVAQNCRELETLALNDCSHLTDASLVAVAHGCTMLVDLNVSRCRHVSDAGVEAVLDYCAELRSLAISGCHAIKGLAFVEQNIAGTALARIRRVQTLFMGDCPSLHRSSAHWAAVAFEHLDRLEMPNCPVLGDESLKSICVHCALLCHLNIAGCSSVTSAGIHAIAQNRTSLLSLNISQVTQADARAVRAVLSQCRQLEQLAMNGLSRASDASFVGAFSSRGDAAPRAPAVLRELSLIKCPKITDDAVSYMVQRLPGLVTLKLSLCELVSDEAVILLAQCCRELRTLGLARNPSGEGDICRRTTIPTFLTDVSLKAIGRCRSLTELDMQANPYLEGTGLRNSTLPKLRAANFRGCTALSPDGLRCILNASPLLTDLDLTGCEHLDARDTDPIATLRAYTQDNVAGLGVCPAANAKSIMVRDAFFARLELEKSAVAFIWKHFRAHQHRWYCLQMQSARTITRALRAYHFRITDPDCVRFRRYYRERCASRLKAAMTLQRWLRKWNRDRIRHAATLIQNAFRRRRARWLILWLKLRLFAAGRIAASWRGYLCRQACTLPVKRLQRQWEREIIEEEGDAPAGSRSVDGLREHVSSLRSELDGLMTWKDADDRQALALQPEFQKRDPISLPLEHKRRLPVFGDMKVRRARSSAPPSRKGLAVILSLPPPPLPLPPWAGLPAEPGPARDARLAGGVHLAAANRSGATDTVQRLRPSAGGIAGRYPPGER